MKIYILIIINIFLLIFVSWFLLTSKKRQAKLILKKKILSDSDSNYSDTAKNIAMSISKSKALYKNLIAKVHPDKFFHHKDKIKNEKVAELASRITKSKRNYDELRKIEIEVTEFLKES